MIELHRLNGSYLMLNHKHIEIIESMPDTLITLTNDKKYIVKETPAEIREKIIDFYKKFFQSNIPDSVDI